MYNLEQLGLGAQSLNCDEATLTRIVRVASEHGDRYDVLGASSERFTVSVSGRLLDDGERPAVGDFVVLDESRARIEQLLPRRSVLERQAAGTKTRRQVIAANIDVVFIVTSMNDEFNESRLERYVAAVWESGAVPVIILNKADLAGDPGHFVARATAAAPGVDVVTMTAVSERSAEKLSTYVGEGKTFVFVGSSGVGKSTIVNAVAGEQIQDTGAIRLDDDEGRHTTTSRNLVVLGELGVLIDTPGMRELQLWDAEEGISAAFSDLEELALNCRFRDCAHAGEPGCAIAEALAAGDVDERRLANYQKLLREAEYHNRKRDAAATRRFGREWAKKVRQANVDRW